MAKRKKKGPAKIHRVFPEGPLKSVELPKPTDSGHELEAGLTGPKDPGHDLDFERALIDWIVAHREKWKRKQKPGGQ